MIMLDILGHPTPVCFITDLTALGRARQDRMEIHIDDSLSLSQKQATLLHEILELINLMLNIKLDETAICALETGLYQVLVSNGVDLSPLFKEKNA